MLWGKKKGAPSGAAQDRAAKPPGRDPGADAERALDAVANLLRLYGKYAFDVDSVEASEISARCDEWASRILVGAPRSADAESDGPKPLVRDWGGLGRFVRDQRLAERDYVVRSLGCFRDAVRCFAGCLSSALGEDRKSDERVGERLDGLSRALEQGDAASICAASRGVVDEVRQAMAHRRKREVEQVWQLGQSLRELRDELSAARRLAEVDSLTQLSNRAAFDSYLEHLASLGLLLGEPPWLFLVDLDHFKAVNDTHGHPAGDEVLRQISHGLSRTFLRKQDFVCRYGGEEFAVLLLDTTEAQAEAFAERLLSAARERVVEHEGKRISVTLSIGLAAFEPGDSAERWLARADEALYRAKNSGRDRYELASESAALDSLSACSSRPSA